MTVTPDMGSAFWNCHRRVHWDDPPAGWSCIGTPTRNVTTWFPATEPLYPFAAERNFQMSGTLSTAAADNFHVPVITVALYLLFCWGGTKLMASRSPLKAFRPLWKVWNLILAIFSFCGMVRMVPHLYGMLLTDGFRVSVCQHPGKGYGHSGASGMWTSLFIGSKFPELLDTVFIVALKRPLIFLHWYHHATVLLFCWHAFATRSAAGIWFIAMNYTVHAFMYFYYYLALASPGLKRMLAYVAPVITFMQISQMFVGVAICYFVWKFKAEAEGCDVSDSNWMWSVLMYSSYYALFVYLAVERYCCSRGGREINGKDTDGKQRPHAD